MKYQDIHITLKDYDKVKVEIFVNYLKSLESAKDRDGRLKNPWFKYVTVEQLTDLYKKVAQDEGLFIDGETITLQKKGSLMVDYNYQAFKNKLLSIYPETLFDLQNVYNKDTFSFKKVDGKVKYTHNINNPFELDKEIVGCYCIIKNKRGEFIEMLDMDDIKKMRNVAKTQKIWSEWFSEMVLKSVIKRACKRHFKDIVTNIEVLDNENYDLDNVKIDHKIQDMIDNCQTLEDLQLIYERYKDEVEDHANFMRLLGETKSEIKNISK